MYKDITKDTLQASRLSINNSDPWTGRVRFWEEMRDYSIPWLAGEAPSLRSKPQPVFYREGYTVQGAPR